MPYKYYQPNIKDLKDNYGDCSIRCLAKAMNKEWVPIFDELVPIARQMQQMPNNKDCIQKFLKQNGFIYQGISNKKGSKRPTVKSFSGKNKTGVFVLVVANHYVCCYDGIYYDTWDCGHKSLYGYWEKQTEGAQNAI